MAKTIIFEIDEDGTVTMDGENFSGSECHALLEAYRAKLGKLKDLRRKPEFYNKQAQKQKTRIANP